MLITGDSPMEFFINLPVACINAAVADHFIMLFRDMLDETLNKFHNGKRFLHIFVILMTVVMEGNKIAIVIINPGSGNHRTPQVTPDVFYNFFRVASVRFCIDIETIFMFPVTTGFNLFERSADSGFHFIQKGGTERITEEGIVKVIGIAPKSAITIATFRNETVDMGIPFQIPAKGVKNHNETGCEVHGLILLKKHA